MSNSQLLALRHEKQLKGTVHNVALLTARPLLECPKQTQCAFVAIETNLKREQRDHVLKGWVNSYGPHAVTYQAETLPVVGAIAPQSTLVLRGRVRKDAATKQHWEGYAGCSSPMQLKQHLQTLRTDIHVTDLFRMEKDNESVT